MLGASKEGHQQVATFGLPYSPVWRAGQSGRLFQGLPAAAGAVMIYAPGTPAPPYRLRPRVTDHWTRGVMEVELRHAHQKYLGWPTASTGVCFGATISCH